jgi:A/G-specific adenine glycosylase
MLQQTRVEAVKAYFDRFIEALPDIKALANAKEDEILKLWEGLGYYNRVRNLQKAAITVMEQYEGDLPGDYHELLKLSGIGSYTAGAIASIAFQIPVPAVDGNVLRVTKRIAGSFDDITKASVKKEVEQDLQEIMPTNCPGEFNQALMELGAMVCIPNGKPLCESCPVNQICEAYKQDIAMQIPVKPPKKARTIEEKTVLLLEYQSKYAIHQRGSKGLLAGLWELPNVEGKLPIDKIERLLNENGIEDYEMELLGEAKHIFSHIEWHMLGYRIHILKKGHELGLDDIVWADKEQIQEQYALPTAFQAYRERI